MTVAERHDNKWCVIVVSHYVISNVARALWPAITSVNFSVQYNAGTDYFCFAMMNANYTANLSLGHVCSMWYTTNNESDTRCLNFSPKATVQAHHCFLTICLDVVQCARSMPCHEESLAWWKEKKKAGFEPQPYKHEASYINVIVM